MSQRKPLSEELGYFVPDSHVLLPSESKVRMFDRDFSLREIKCECDAVLCALVIVEEHVADVVWPFDVICNKETHVLVPKGTEGAAKVSCHGKAIQEWEAKEYLKKYMPAVSPSLREERKK
jgi:hypothetical protein